MTGRKFCNLPIFCCYGALSRFWMQRFGPVYVCDLNGFVVTEGRSVWCSSLVLWKRGGRNTLGKYPYPERKEINRSR